MGGLFILMKAIDRHYERVSRELTPNEEERGGSSSPAAITPSSWCPICSCPRCGALAYARATRPDVLEALTVNVDDGETRG